VKAKGKYRWSSSFGRIYSVGGNEINAKTQRSEGAKRMKLDQSCLLNSNRNRPARETFFTCVFAPLRLCVEILLNTCGFGLRRKRGLKSRGCI
jgi:hypothetical protein